MDNNSIQSPMQQPFTQQPVQPMSQPITQPVTPPVAPIAPQPKPKHTSKIVAIIMSVIVLLAGAGFAIYYFLIRPQDPSVVASRMMSQLGANLSSGKTLSVASSVTISQPFLSAEYPETKSIKLGLDSIGTSDWHLYIKLSGLEPIVALISGNFNTGSMEKDDLAEYNDFMEALTKLDDHWIGLDLNDINQQLGSVIDFDCISDYSKASNGQLSDLYQKYPFVVLTPSEDNFYQLNLKESELTDFLASYINSMNGQDVGKCLASDKFGPISGDFGTITADDINLGILASLPNLYVSVDKDYNLTELKFSLDAGSATIAANFNFAYAAAADALIPTDAYSIDDLQPIIETLMYPVTNLQISQRNTQRRNDIMRVQMQITNYQTNNRGQLPTDWDAFYRNYLVSDGDDFTDPDGTDYILSASDVPTTVPEFLNHTIYITTGATCGDNGETSATTRSRAYAIQYRLESGTLYCLSD